MTCIVGWAENGISYIGGDSAGVSKQNLRIRADEKVFSKGNMILGCAGSYRIIQILRYMFKIPRHPKGCSDYEYLVSIFTDKLIELLTDKYAAQLKDNLLGSEGFILLGYHGKIYNIEPDFHVGQNLCGYDACGSGENYALGALAAIAKYEMNPIIRIRETLDAASQFCNAVKPPYIIVIEGKSKGIRIEKNKDNLGFVENLEGGLSKSQSPHPGTQR